MTLEELMEKAFKKGFDRGFTRGYKIGLLRSLIELISQNLRKGYSPSRIASKLEEDYLLVEAICKVAERFSPVYDTDQIYEALKSDPYCSNYYKEVFFPDD